MEQVKKAHKKVGKKASKKTSKKLTMHEVIGRWMVSVNGEYMRTYDLTWFNRSSLSDIETLLNDISMNEWTITGSGNVVIKANKDLFFRLIEKQAEGMNEGRDIHDARTIGGKFFKKMTKNEDIKTIKIYETDYGIITFKEIYATKK